jgi:hypothetical protein
MEKLTDAGSIPATSTKMMSRDNVDRRVATILKMPGGAYYEPSKETAASSGNVNSPKQTPEQLHTSLSKASEFYRSFGNCNSRHRRDHCWKSFTGDCCGDRPNSDLGQ